jgi:predicted TPR repeat methyltransferase
MAQSTPIQDEVLAEKVESRTTELSVPEALSLALQCHQGGDLNAAERIYHAVLDLAPDQPDALHFLGILTHQRGQSERGIELIRRAIAAAPENPGMLNNLGNILYQVDRFEEAAAAYTTALGIAPEAGTYNNLGATHRVQGQVELAQAAFERALRLDPNNAGAHHNFANLLASTGRVREAVEHYCIAITLMPSDPSAARKLGIAYSMLGRKEEACAVYQDWLRREPGNAVARHMLAACSEEAPPGRASNECITQMFDNFARNFDEKLAKLEYQAPELCRAAVAAAVGTPARGLVALDAGCGTGLCGPLIAPFVSHLTGVDLSGQMLAKARAGGHYDELVQAELTEYLGSQQTRFDLIVCADTLCYFGPLDAVLGAAANALAAAGTLVFSVELAPEELARERGHHLNLHGRYSHSERYLRSVLEGARLQLAALVPGVIRNEGGSPVAGLILTARKG